jgi:hypothetical protein
MDQQPGLRGRRSVVIWAGLFAYRWRLDRRISGKERE